MRRRRLRDARRKSPLMANPRVLKVELTVVLLGIALLGGFYLDRHPIDVGGGSPPRQDGTPFVGSDDAEVLLLLPEMGAPVSDFAELDSASNWHNTLEQEFGPHQAMQLSQFSPSALEGISLVVVPAAVSRNATVGQIATLEQFVVDGGRLVVEMPTRDWAVLSSAVVNPTEIRATRRITAFDGARVRGDLRDDAIRAPLHTVMAPVAIADVRAVDGLETVLEVDGLPGITRRPYGSGEVFSLYFDFARAVLAIQQGTPTSEWEISRPSAPLPPGFTRTSCLTSARESRANPAPSADLLEHNLATVITMNRPMPRVWTFPGTYSGAFVMTHSAIPDASSGAFMTAWESDGGNPSTTFLVADDEVSTAATGQPDSGLLLVPPGTPNALYGEIGLFGFNPVRREVSLENQVQQFQERRTSSDPPLMTRIAEGLWNPDYGRTFQELAALGVEVDSSYGPAFAPTDLDAENGYSFGTGLPFQPVDRNGLLLPILEIPYILHDGHSFEPGWTAQTIDEAGRAYNELVVADWRTGTMRYAPRAGLVTTWRDSFSLARGHGLWATDLATFVRFWHLRRQVSLSSRFDPSERRLVISATLPHGLEQDEEMIGPSIAFEAFFQGRPIERITRNGQDVPFVELGLSADGVLHLFRVPQGTHRIEVTYQGQIEVLQ